MSERWDVEAMNPIAQAWDEAMRAEVPSYARLVPEAEQRGSVLRPGASEAQIAAAQDRLGVSLPASYRSFLQLSDGAWAGRFGADYFTRTLRPSYRGLLPVERLVPLADGDPALIEVWADSGEFHAFVDRQEPARAGEPVDVYDFEPIRRALLITERVQNAELALVPFPDEWQVWSFDHASVTAFVSFADWLTWHTMWARKRFADRDPQRILDAIRSGSTRAAGLLADWGDPRALDVASAILLDPAVPESEKPDAAGTLAALGDPRAIDALRRALAAMTTPRARLQVLEALDVCGDPDALSALERFAREEPNETVRGYAASYLGRRDTLRRPWAS